MADVLDEDVLSCAAAARHLTKVVKDQRFSPAGVWRWMHDGLLAADGQRVRLEFARLGRRLVTSKQAIARFSQRLSSCGGDVPAPTAEETDAKAELTAAGFYK